MKSGMPNLYGMLDNVSEWINSEGPIEQEPKYYLTKGGNYNFILEMHYICGHRSSYYAVYRTTIIGFRLALDSQ